MSAKVEHHPETLIQGNPKFSSVTQHISQIVEDKTKMGWILLFGLSASILMMLLGAVGYLLFEGIGIWGNNQPVSWAFDIVNFVFWVGIGHAGTLISAILVPVPPEVAYFDQPLRRSDDHFRGHLRAAFPVNSRWPCLVAVLGDAASEPDGNVAELPQSAAVGYVRGRDVFHLLAAFLVCGVDS